MAGMLNITVRGAALSRAGRHVAAHQFDYREREGRIPAHGHGTSGGYDIWRLRPVPENGRRPNYLQVTLVPAEEFGFAPGASLRPPTGPEDDSLVIEMYILAATACM